MAALSDKFLLRGAVVCGELHHSKNNLFGPAMIKSHKLEIKMAVYP